MQEMLIYKITIFYLFPSYVDILLICGTFVKGKTNVELQRTSSRPDSQGNIRITEVNRI